MGHMTINTITTTYDIKKVLPWWLLMLSVLLILIISILFCPNIHPDDQDTQTKYLFSWYNFIKYSRVYNSYQICLSKIRLGIILILFKCQNSCKQQFQIKYHSNETKTSFALSVTPSHVSRIIKIINNQWRTK